MSDLGSTAGFYAARPQISIDGRDHAGLTDGLLTLLVEETTQGLYRCEATFGNWGTANGEVGFLYFDRRVLDFGKAMAVSAGSDETEAQVFSGRITGVEAHYPQRRPPEILILAEDRLQDLRMTRRTRVFEEMSDSDVIQQIASTHSLQAEVDINGPTYRLLAQVNQSDLAFLRERARAVDAELWIDNRTLHVQARNRRRSERVTLTYGQGLIEFSVLADLAGQRTSFSVSGWDVADKEAIVHEATESAIRSELNGFQSGINLLQSAFGQRADQAVHMAPMTLEEAQHLAEAGLRRLARRFITGKGICQGDGRMRVGALVELQGLGAMFDGAYYVTQVCHTFDGQNGYRTEFTVERPGLGSA
jgi:phage protein D